MTALSHASLFVAQTTQPGTTATAATHGKPAPGFADLLASPMFPLLLGIIVLYVFMFRSKRKQEQQMREQLSQVKRGDEVMMAGGIIGKIVDVRDSKVQVKVDENSNTKIWFTRDAIRRVMTDDKAEAAK